MKKLSLILMAAAAMAFTMTSCNKEESAATPGSLTFSLEDNEIMNEAKSHFVGLTQWWDENDRVYVVDGSRNAAWYQVAFNNGDVNSVRFDFVRRDYGVFDENNGPICAYFPASIRSAREHGKCVLPRVQTSADGQINGLPVYGEGQLNGLEFSNLCAIIRFKVTTNRPIDSISITTDQYMNGTFSINMNNTAAPLTYYTTDGHGTKTMTVKYTGSLNNMNNEYAYMWIPAGTYTVFNITVYSGDQVWVKRNTNPVTVKRNVWNSLTLNCNTATFENNVMGSTNALFTVFPGHRVYFAKGNVQWNAQLTQFWRFADNQWDCLDRWPQMQTGNNRDRDLFAWGANGYVRGGYLVQGNGITIWPTTSAISGFNYYDGMFLDGNNDWGSNRFANGGNTTDSWRTLGAFEWDYLLNNAHPTLATLTFAGITGLVLFPDNYVGNGFEAGAELDKAAWNALEAAGCVFLPIQHYRKASGSFNSCIPTTTELSYYWTAQCEVNQSNETTSTRAYALELTPTYETPSTDNGNITITLLDQRLKLISKRMGAYVRLVQDAEVEAM